MPRALIVRCWDRRLLGPVYTLITDKGLMGDCFDLTADGGARCLAGIPREEKSVLTSSLAMAVKYEKVREFMLSVHTDCTSYSLDGKRTHTGVEELSISLLAGELEHAEKYVGERFPKVKVTGKYIFVFNGNNFQELVELF